LICPGFLGAGCLESDGKLLGKMEADAAPAVNAVDHGIDVTAWCALETDQGSPTQGEGANAVRVRDALLAVQRGDAFLDSARCVYSVCDAELFTPWPPGSRTAEMQFALSSRAALNSKFVEDGTGCGTKFRATLRTVKLAGNDMPPVGVHVRVMLTALGLRPAFFARSHSPKIKPYINACAVLGLCGTGSVRETCGRTVAANSLRAGTLAAYQSAQLESDESRPA
jgi:hypothetical protein